MSMQTCYGSTIVTIIASRVLTSASLSSTAQLKISRYGVPESLFGFESTSGRSNNKGKTEDHLFGHKPGRKYTNIYLKLIENVPKPHDDYQKRCS